MSGEEATHAALDLSPQRLDVSGFRSGQSAQNMVSLSEGGDRVFKSWFADQSPLGLAAREQHGDERASGGAIEVRGGVGEQAAGERTSFGDANREDL